MTYDLRWVLVMLANFFLIVLVGEVNHYLSIIGLHVFVAGLLLTFGVLRLQLKQGLMANGATALVLDAINPLPFGTTFLLLLTCHTFIFSIRSHFGRESLKSGLLVAVGLNLFLMTAFGVLAAQDIPTPGIYWGRIALESLVSVAAVLAIAPWFLALQKITLLSIGIDLDAEQREAQ